MAESEPSSALIEIAFREHYRDVYRFLLRRTGDHHEAEELAQQVFFETATALGRFPGEAPVLAWLYTVAQRRFIDECRRRGRFRVEPVVDEIPERGSGDYGRETARAIGGAIASLSLEQREVVVLKLLKGASFAEIAERLGISEVACRMRFSRAMRTLRERLEQERLP